MDTHEQLRSAADTIWELRNKLADMVDQREEIERLRAESEMPRYDGMDYEELVTAAQFSWLENAKLRDAMYTNAGKHALQHMDEDELRIWATQQSEYIDELLELCRDLFDRLMDKDEHCGECRSQCEHDAWNFGDPKCVYAKRMRELGVEVDG